MGSGYTFWPRHQWQVTPASSLWSQFSWPNPLKGHRARDLSLPEHSTLSIRIGPVPSPKWAPVKAAADLIWNINTKCKLRNSNSVNRYMHILIKWLDSKIQINVAILNIELLKVIWNSHFTLWGTPEYDKPHVRHRRPNCRHTPSPSRRPLWPLPSLLDWNFLQPIVCQLKRKTTNRM